MPKTSPDKENALLSAAALRLAAKLGWENVTLAAVAKATKMPAAKLEAKFATLNGLVPVIAEQIDHEAFANSGTPTGTPHDRLFDLLMARFDILQQNRAAIESMAAASQHDRALLCALSRAAFDSAYRFIDAAQLKDKTPPRAVIAAGLVAIYGWAILAWRKDSSRDMAKTMAAVDRGLRWAEKGVGLLKPRS